MQYSQKIFEIARNNENFRQKIVFLRMESTKNIKKMDGKTRKEQDSSQLPGIGCRLSCFGR